MAEKRFSVRIALLEDGEAATFVVVLPVDPLVYNGLVKAIDEAKQMLIESIASGYVRG